MNAKNLNEQQEVDDMVHSEVLPDKEGTLPSSLGASRTQWSQDPLPWLTHLKFHNKNTPHD